jgi:TonB family protein
MAWVPKIALALSAGIAAAQQSPVVVDPEEELLFMLHEWRQQPKGNGGLPAEPPQGAATTAETAATPGGCMINGKPQSPCPSIANLSRRDHRSPMILSALQPEYPALAAASAIRGRVIVLVTVDENGIPRDPKVISVSATDADGQLIKGSQNVRFRTGGPRRGSEVDLRAWV